MKSKSHIEIKGFLKTHVSQTHFIYEDWKISSEMKE